MPAADSWYHEKESAWLYGEVAPADVARLLRHFEPRHLRRVLAAMKLRGLSAPEHALDVLAREELGLNPDDPGLPLGAAASSFGCFAVGAAVPLLPFLFRGVDPIYAAAALTVCALFGLGVLLSLFTGHSALRGGLRQVLIGGGAGLAAWSIGRLLGASVG